MKHVWIYLMMYQQYIVPKSDCTLIYCMKDGVSQLNVKNICAICHIQEKISDMFIEIIDRPR